MNSDLLENQHRQVVKLNNYLTLSQMHKLFKNQKYNQILQLNIDLEQQEQIQKIVSHLSGLTELVDLIINMYPIFQIDISLIEIFTCLESLTNLRTFQFTFQKFSGAVIYPLKEINQGMLMGLKYLHKVEKLSIKMENECIFSFNNSKTLYKGLKRMLNLEFLQLKFNIESSIDGCLSFKMLQKKLIKLKKLNSLDLTFTILENEKQQKPIYFHFDLNSLTNLKQLNLDLSYDESQITKIPNLSESLISLNNLIKLQLLIKVDNDDGQFSSLFDNVFNLISLEECEIHVKLNKQFNNKMTIGKGNNQISKIKVLNISVQQYDDNCQLEFGEGLMCLQYVTELKIQNNLFLNVQNLASTFQVWLKKLQLEKLYININCFINQEILSTILAGTENQLSLQQLEFYYSYCPIDNETILQIFQVIGTIISLKTLSIYNIFQSDCLNSTSVVNSLKSLTNLQKITLQVNGFQNVTFSLIWPSFEYLTSLLSLRIEIWASTQIKDISMELFKEKIDYLQNLKELKFDCRTIFRSNQYDLEEEQVKNIFLGISKLKQLKILKICIFPSEAAQLLVCKQITTYMSQLKNINTFQLFYKNNFTPSQQKVITSKVKKQKRIVTFF